MARHLGLQIGLGLLAGIPAGVASWLFLEVLERAIDLREDEAGWLLWLLPFGAFAIVALYHHVGGRAVRGSSLVIEQVHEPTDDGVPLRMGPLVLIGTVAAHLFGASVGREGTAIQMSASLSDSLARAVRIRGVPRRELLVAAVAGGFGAVFGVPVAGAVFALEVQTIGRLRYEAVLAAFTASFAGDRIVRALGHDHPTQPQLSLDVDVWRGSRLAIAGIAFGLAAALFVWLTHRVKSALTPIRYPPVRAALAGAVVVVAVLALGREYTSLSLPFADSALAGAQVGALVWLGKLVVTSVSLGGGLPGGEVTPLFVVGATLGAALADPLGLPQPVLAAVGFVAVFGGAANTPIACTLLAVELFGGGVVVPAALACAVAYVCSGHTGIYPTQVIEVRKHR
ncbi:MAG: chloride channel protein [Acidimicrobiia bacterium]